jgi:YVTN family beta-propeller protein
VTAENSATVHVIDTTVHEVVHTIQLTGEMFRPMGVVVSSDSSTVYVTTGRGRTVVAIDAATYEPVASVEVGTRPWGIGITRDGRYLYTANGPSNDVSVVDTNSMSVVATVPVGEMPWGIAIIE